MHTLPGSGSGSGSGSGRYAPLLLGRADSTNSFDGATLDLDLQSDMVDKDGLPGRDPGRVEVRLLGGLAGFRNQQMDASLKIEGAIRSFYDRLPQPRPERLWQLLYETSFSGRPGRLVVSTPNHFGHHVKYSLFASLMPAPATDDDGGYHITMSDRDVRLTRAAWASRKHRSAIAFHVSCRALRTYYQHGFACRHDDPAAAVDPYTQPLSLRADRLASGMYALIWAGKGPSGDGVPRSCFTGALRALRARLTQAGWARPPQVRERAHQLVLTLVNLVSLSPLKELLYTLGDVDAFHSLACTVLLLPAAAAAEAPQYELAFRSAYEADHLVPAWDPHLRQHQPPHQQEGRVLGLLFALLSLPWVDAHLYEILKDTHGHVRVCIMMRGILRGGSHDGGGTNNSSGGDVLNTLADPRNRVTVAALESVPVDSGVQQQRGQRGLGPDAQRILYQLKNPRAGGHQGGSSSSALWGFLVDQYMRHRSPAARRQLDRTLAELRGVGVDVRPLSDHLRRLAHAA